MELLALSKYHTPEKKFKIDQIAEDAGHEVIRLPPYHCNFNPIELVWAFEKVIIQFSKTINISKYLPNFSMNFYSD